MAGADFISDYLGAVPDRVAWSGTVRFILLQKGCSIMKKSFAVIGYGGQGGWHVRQILGSDVAALAGIYDCDERKQQLAEDAGIRVYPSVEALLADPAVDGVVIATPNDSHRELVLRCIGAGKAVICEKPVEMTVSAFDEMAAAAKQAGILFTVHQNRRWDVDFLAMKKLVTDGQIGNLIRIESRIHGSRGIPSDWRGTRAQGGGMLLDWGVHLIDQILQIIPGELVRVYCTGTHLTNKEVDDGFRLELTFGDGKTAYVEVGTYNFLPMPRFYLQCSGGSAIIEDWRKNAQVAKMKAWNEKEVLPVQTAAGITKTMAPRDALTLDQWEADRPVSDVHDFYRNFCAVLDGREPPLVTLSQVRRVMRVMEEAFASMEQGQVIITQI